MSFPIADDVRGKNVLVTGASSGIGRETALYSCELGANVVITARREKVLKEVWYSQRYVVHRFRLITLSPLGYVIKDFHPQVVEECKKVGVKGARHGYVTADMGDADSVSTVIPVSRNNNNNNNNDSINELVGTFIYKYM